MRKSAGPAPTCARTAATVPGPALQGQFEHCQPMTITGRLVRLQRRALRRNKPNRIQVARPSHLRRERQMAIVYRIEGPAKQADPLPPLVVAWLDRGHSLIVPVRRGADAVCSAVQGSTSAPVHLAAGIMHV